MDMMVSLGDEEWISRLIQSGHAFAKWRMPGEEKWTLIISLGLPNRYGGQHISLLGSGFLINKFDDHHPYKPLFIGGDIVLESGDIFVAPRVTSGMLDRFCRGLDGAVSPKDGLPNFPGHSRVSFEDLVEDAVHLIKQGEMRKVVLSCCRDVMLPSGFSVSDYFEALTRRYPHAFCSLVHLPNEGLWVGATPELLIMDDGKVLETHAVAGTKKLCENQVLTDVLWTPKEIEEQAMVSRYIINCFERVGLTGVEATEPKAMEIGELAHLKTVFTLRYAALGMATAVSEMLGLLHPTSAVCGMPMERALRYIKEREGYDRSYYSGFLGPVNFRGCSHLFVNLRCMQIGGGRARLYAGAGITEGSEAEEERLETELKMGALTSLLG